MEEADQGDGHHGRLGYPATVRSLPATVRCACPSDFQKAARRELRLSTQTGRLALCSGWRYAASRSIRTMLLNAQTSRSAILDDSPAMKKNGCTQGPPMWPPNLSGLSTADQQGVIARICSEHGTVIRVVLHRTEVRSGLQAFALVDMSDVMGAEQLAAACDRPRMGTAVILLLQPLSPA